MLEHHSYMTLQLVVDTHHILDHTQHNTEHLDNTQTLHQFSSKSKNNSITLFIVYSLSEEYTDTPSYTQHNNTKETTLVDILQSMKCKYPLVYSKEHTTQSKKHLCDQFSHKTSIETKCIHIVETTR